MFFSLSRKELDSRWDLSGGLYYNTVDEADQNGHEIRIVR